MAQRVRKFVDRAFSRTVDLDLLRRLLEPHLDQIGFDWQSLPDDDRARREKIFELFERADARFPPQLQFALYNISILSTDAGARLIQDIASEFEIDVLAGAATNGRTDEERFTPRYIALRTWLDHRRVFSQALSAAAFLAYSAKLERDADRDDLDPRHHKTGVKKGFAAAARRHFASRYNGRYCDVRWFDEDDLVKVLLLHGSKADTKNIDRDGVEDKVSFREIVQSTLEYDRARASITVGSKSMTDAKKLVKLFAEHVLGNADIFEASAKKELYTLEPIRRRGASFRFNFDRNCDITRVVLKEVRVDEGQRMANGRIRRSPWLLTLRDSENALRRLRDIAPDVELRDLRFVQAKIDVGIDVDGSETVVPVTIKPPRMVSMRDHSHERLILDMLEDNEIRKARRPGQAAAAAE